MAKNTGSFKAEYLNNQKTSKMRLAFPHIFSPDEGQYGQGKYKAMGLIPKEERDILKENKKSLLALAQKSWPNIKWADLEHPFKDGDLKPTWTGFPDSEYVTFKSNKKPMVSLVTGRDNAGKLVFERCDKDDIKAGDYVRFGFSAFTYEREKVITKEIDGREVEIKKMVQGVSLILESVLKVAEGEGFGGSGGGASNDRFDDEEMDDIATGASSADPDSYDSKPTDIDDMF
jgi:hypothetical protein